MSRDKQLVQSNAYDDVRADLEEKAAIEGEITRRDVTDYHSSPLETYPYVHDRCHCQHWVRFMPIIRTFVPFVAGAGAMTYRPFLIYNVAGGLLWVGACVGAGYAFGNVPVVKANFSLVALGIVVVSLLPMLIELLKRRGKAGAA